MKLAWSTTAWKDYIYWQQTDRKKLRRINTLIKEVLRDPIQGMGNPEPLRYELQGFWSRRIDREHRLVYTYNSKEILIIACRYHYPT